jgi:hypothetical protein
VALQYSIEKPANERGIGALPEPTVRFTTGSLAATAGGPAATMRAAVTAAQVDRSLAILTS